MPGILQLAQRPVNRRVTLVGTGGVAVSALLGALPLGAAAQHGTPIVPAATPAGQVTGDNDAVALLTSAATAMTKLDSFTFSVVTARGETTILEGFTLDEINGAVRRPLDFQTVVSVSIPFGSLDLTAVGNDGEVWIEIPEIAGRGGGWQSLGNIGGSGSSTNADAFSLISLLNPDVLILEAIRYIDNAAISDTGDVDGVNVTYVTGSVDFGVIASQFLDDTSNLPMQISEKPVGLTIAIDDDSLIREIEMAGPLLTSESDNVIRLVTFSNFNEPVEIEQPDV